MPWGSTALTPHCVPPTDGQCACDPYGTFVDRSLPYRNETSLFLCLRRYVNRLGVYVFSYQRLWIVGYPAGRTPIDHEGPSASAVSFSGDSECPIGASDWRGWDGASWSVPDVAVISCPPPPLPPSPPPLPPPSPPPGRCDDSCASARDGVCDEVGRRTGNNTERDAAAECARGTE